MAVSVIPEPATIVSPGGPEVPGPVESPQDAVATAARLRTKRPTAVEVRARVGDRPARG
jgi:hypothetical protein